MSDRFPSALICIMACLITLSMLSSPALAEEPPERSPAQARLLTAMVHRHHLPSVETLRQLEQDLDVETTLHAYLLHPETAPLLRARTLLVLRHYPSVATRDVVTTFIQQTSAEAEPDMLYLGRALRLVGQALGAPHPEWALAQLSPFTAHADVGIREEVLKGLLALREIPALQTRVDALLLQRNLAERAPHLRRVLKEGLSSQPLRLPSHLHSPEQVQQP